MNTLRKHILYPLLLVLTVGLFLFIPLIVSADRGPDLAQQFVWGLVVAVTGRLVWLGGVILDAGINTFVIDFGSLFLTSGVGQAVDTTWVVIRDFMNLLFIFGLVYIGFKMILGSDNSNTRRWLVNLILAALLVNFSLFITKFVVDFSNQVATNIVLNGFDTVPTPNPRPGQSATRVAMSDGLMNIMGITSILGFDFGSNETNLNASQKNAWGYIFGTAIFFMITAFVFAAGGVLLIIRFAILSLYIVMSPFMFIGWILPPLGSVMSQYWKGFLKRCFFAPIYFLFLYLSFAVLANFQTSLGGIQSGAWSNALGGSTGPVLSASQSVVPFFILTSIFMIASLVAAQKVGADGAGQAIKIGQDLRRRVQRGVGTSTAGLGAAALRNSVGRNAYKYTQDDKNKMKAANSRLGRLQYKANQWVAGQSFDARQVGGAGKALGVGEGQKGGFSKIVDDRKKADEKFKKDIGYVDTKSGEGKARKEAEEARIKAEAEKEKTEAEELSAQLEENLNTSSEAFIASITTLTSSIDAAKKKLEKDDKDGLVTEKDKEEREKAIKEEEKKLAQKQAALSLVERTSPQLIAKQKAQSALASYMYAGGGDKAEETRLRNEAEKAEAAYNSQIASERSNLKAKITAADVKSKEADITAEAGIKYERQLAYLAQKEREQSGIIGRVAKLSSAGTGAGLLGYSLLASGGIATGGLGGLIGAAGAVSGVQSQYYLKNLEIEAMREELGEGGKKAFNKQKKKDKTKDLAAAIVEDADKPEKDEPKKDDAAT